MTIVDPNQTKADEELKNKNYKEAIQLYTELINKKIDTPRNYHKRAQCFLQLRINKNGFDDAQAAMDLNPQNPAIYETLTKCCITLNDLKTATETLEKLGQMDPDNAFVRAYRPKVNKIKSVYAEVEDEMEEKNYKVALAKIIECSKLIDCNSFYRNEKIRILVYLKDFPQAEKEINDLLFASKVDVEAIQLRALLLWYKGKDILAMRELELAEKLNKYLGGYQITNTISNKLHLQCHFLKYASNKLEAGDYENAIKFFLETIKQDKHNAVVTKQALYKLGLCYDKLDQIDAAIKKCAESLEVDPDYKAALELQADCYRKNGQSREAERIYKKLLGTEDSEKYRNCLKEVQSGSASAKNTDEGKDTDWGVLGVRESATLKEVQEAYRKKARLYHTDQHVGKDQATLDANRNKMDRLNQAKENMEKRIKQKQLQDTAKPPIERH